ncbi:MAG: glycosyltransferase family 4 protein [bacterium]
MKIMVLTMFYPENNCYNKAGNTKVVHYFTRQWEMEGNEVTVFHIKINPLKNIFSNIYNKAKLIFKNVEMVDNNQGVSVLKIESQLLKPKSRKLLNFQQKKIARKINMHVSNKSMGDFDVIVVHFPMYMRGIVERIQLKCAKVATLHITDQHTLELLKNQTERKKFLSIYDGIGFRSKIIQENCLKLVNLKQKKFIIYSGIPEKYLINKEKLMLKLKENGTPIKIIYVGQMIRRKKVYEIISALGIIKDDFDYKFTIVGNGKELQRCKKAVIQYSLSKRVNFLGKLSRENVFNAMRNSDIFIMISEKETFGLVYLEAMASGCIVIASKNEGIDGVIMDGYNGFLIPAGDEVALAKILLKVNNMSNEERRQIKINAYETANKMTDKRMAQIYLENIKKVINTKDNYNM